MKIKILLKTPIFGNFGLEFGPNLSRKWQKVFIPKNFSSSGLKSHKWYIYGYSVSDQFEIKIMIKNSIFEHFRLKFRPTNLTQKLAKSYCFQDFHLMPSSLKVLKHMGSAFSWMWNWNTDLKFHTWKFWTKIFVWFRFKTEPEIRSYHLYLLYPSNAFNSKFYHTWKNKKECEFLHFLFVLCLNIFFHLFLAIYLFKN